MDAMSGRQATEGDRQTRPRAGHDAPRHESHRGRRGEQETPRRDGDDAHGMAGMVEMARRNEAAHLAPAPGAAAPESDPFPRPLMVGLLLGALGGALVGLGFAALLLGGTLAVRGWEQLFSMSPGTFSTFWVGLGAAAGILLGGVATILVTPISSRAEAATDDRRSRIGDHRAG